MADQFELREERNEFSALDNVIRGPAGPAGPQGPQGEPGVDGTVSFDELTPAQRESLRGPQGIQGEKGDKGDTGADGAPGAKGDTGSQGPKGDKGDTGDDGYSPAVTISTITGGHSVSITDKTHPTGQSFTVMDGADGATGPQGPKGDPGNYTKPDTGIPLTDLASDVQASLGKADEAYIKPNTGIPKTDLASDVQTSLEKADIATPIGLGMTGTTVGRVPVVKTVDANGIPTSYEPGVGVNELENALNQLKADTFGSINLTGTNNTGSTITAGTFFYNNGTLVKAKTDIQNGSTITIGTNAETVTAGGLNDLNNSLPQSKTSNVTNVHASANMRGSLILGKYGKIVSPFGYFQITNTIGTTQTLANIDDSSFYPNNVAFLSAIKTGTTTVSVISVRPNGTITTGDFSLTSGYYVVTGCYMTN